MSQNPKVIKVHGAQVAIYPIPGLKAVSVCIKTRGGSWFEKNGQVGKAHLLEHMLFQGTQKYPSSDSMEVFKEENGIYTNAYTSGSQIELVLRMPSESFLKGLELAEEMLFHPLISDESLKIEKNIVIQEHAEYWSRPNYRFHRKIVDRYFGPHHPLTHNSLGEIKYIESLTPTDLQRHREKYIVPANMSIGIAGNISYEEVEAALANILPESGKQTPYEFDKPTFDFTRLEHIEPKLNTSSVEIAWQTKGMDQTELRDQFLINLSSYILGESMHSVLFNKIRNQLGLAYSISSNHVTYPNTGIFTINTSVKPENIEIVISETLQTINTFISRPIDKIEFLRAKKFLIMQKKMNYESTMGTASNLAACLFWDNVVITPEEYSKILDEFSEKEVRDALKEITSKEHLVSIMKS